MKDREFYTKGNRKTIIVRTNVLELPEGHLGRVRPNGWADSKDQELRAAISSGRSIWAIDVFYRTGFDQEQSFKLYVASKDKVEAAIAEYPIGSEYDPLFFFTPDSQAFDANKLSIETELSVYGRGEPPYELIYEVLEGAGVNGRDSQLTVEVLSWIGSDGKQALVDRFGDNWEAVATLEYCLRHFHPTSLATLAARVIVADFISAYSFDEGYASRELEQAYGGAEIVATQSMDTRKAAGTGGGEASKRRRLANLEALITEIEKLSNAVDRFTEDRIVAQAFEAAHERKADFPRTKKIRDGYGTALRSEEPFKSRYEAVFRKNA